AREGIRRRRDHPGAARCRRPRRRGALLVTPRRPSGRVLCPGAGGGGADRLLDRLALGAAASVAALCGVRVIGETPEMETAAQLTVVPTQAEADIGISLLRPNGIRCGERAAEVANIGTAGFGGWREILVAEDQLEDARELLDQT